MADVVEKMNKLLGVVSTINTQKKKEISGEKRKYTFHRDTSGRKRKRSVKT